METSTFDGSGSFHERPSTYNNGNFHNHIRWKLLHTLIDCHPFPRVSTYFHEFWEYFFSASKRVHELPLLLPASMNFLKLPQYPAMFGDFHRLPSTSIDIPSASINLHGSFIASTSIKIRLLLPWKQIYFHAS